MTEPTVDELFDLRGRVALLTGASGWLGQAFAKALAEAGATVVAASRDGEVARKVAADLGEGHHSVVIDQLDEAGISVGFAEAVEVAGKIDILVNNGHAGDAHDLTDASAEDFDKVLKNSTGDDRFDVRTGCLLSGCLRRYLRGEPGFLSCAQGRNHSYDPPSGGLLGEGKRAGELSESGALSRSECAIGNGESVEDQIAHGPDGLAA